jgi:hypothetical protein
MDEVVATALEIVGENVVPPDLDAVPARAVEEARIHVRRDDVTARPDAIREPARRRTASAATYRAGAPVTDRFCMRLDLAVTPHPFASRPAGPSEPKAGAAIPRPPMRPIGPAA